MNETWTLPSKGSSPRKGSKKRSIKQNSKRRIPPCQKRNEVLKLFQRRENGRGGLARYGQRFLDETASKLRFGSEVRYGHEETRYDPSRRKDRLSTGRWQESVGLWWDIVAGPWKTIETNDIGKASRPQSWRGLETKDYKQGMICLILEFRNNKQLHEKCGNGEDRHSEGLVRRRLNLLM